MTRSEKIDLLENYSTFLAANGYMDDDWRSEPPYAIDRFLELTEAPNSEDKGVGELDLKLTPELERTLKDLKKIQESIENLFTAFRIPKDRI